MPVRPQLCMFISLSLYIRLLDLVSLHLRVALPRAPCPRGAPRVVLRVTLALRPEASRCGLSIRRGKEAYLMLLLLAKEIPPVLFFFARCCFPFEGEQS